MSSYEPPPLDPAPLDPGAFGGGRRAHGGAWRSADGASLINPFGPPAAQDLGGDPAAQLPPDGRPVIAFVSGIDAQVGDEWVARILEACGDVSSWRRVHGADGKPQRFGFCEFKTIADAARAVRVLSCTDGLREGGWTLLPRGPAQGTQPMQINVDADVQDALRERAAAGDAPGPDAAAATAALESVERILRELAEAVGEPAKDSDASKPPLLREDGGGRSDPDDGDRKPLSPETEEAREKERAQAHRHRIYLLAAEDRERRASKEQRERDERMERAAMRDLDAIEERQRLRDAMPDMLAKWDDDQQERTREHEYYRDRQRWWHSRKAVRSHELKLDDADRQRQERDEDTKSNAAVHKNPSLTDDGTSIGIAPAQQTAAQALIQEIPADPEALFKWPVKWEHLDQGCVQDKIVPAIRKRLLEYLGGDDEDGSVNELTEYVAAHICGHKPPGGLVEELEMVLVEEAPVFVARIWRFVVYESELRARSAA